MKVFISYSVTDETVIDKVVSALEAIGVNVFCWHKSKQIGEFTEEQIEVWIKQSRLVLAILTDSAISRATTVGMELGYARAYHKPIVPFVHREVIDNRYEGNRDKLGFLAGITYEVYDEKTIEPGLLKIANRMLEVMQQDEQAKREQKSSDKKSLLWLIIIVFGIIFFANVD